MILTGESIKQNYKNKKIIIEPFSEERVNPNSYDITLGDKLLIYNNDILDTKSENNFEIISMPKKGFILKKNQFYLGHSFETIGSDFFVPILHNKSGIARLGLFIHITADLIDIGSIGNLTLQLYPTCDIKIYPQMRIAQVSFWCVYGEILKYSGKYQNSKGPVASKNHLNF